MKKKTRTEKRQYPSKVNALSDTTLIAGGGRAPPAFRALFG
jgi:hypothetical protein